MPQGRRRHPRGLLLVLALTLLALWTFVDLSGPNSILRSLWRQAFPAQTQGEQLRDDVIERVWPRR